MTRGASVLAFTLALTACAARVSPEAVAPTGAEGGGEENAEAPDVIGPTCVVAEPVGPAPSILVATWPEEPPRPPTRDARGRRVIYIDGLDSYGPLRVSVVDAAQTTTDLGEGSDPRMDGDAIVYLASPGSPQGATFVRVLPDGTEERRRGGTGLMEGLGGPVAFWQSPFTRDGRFMALAQWCEEDVMGECAVAVFDRYPSDGDEPIDVLGLERPPSEILLSEGADVVAICTRAEGADGALLVWNRAADAQTTLAITGRCHAMSPSGEHVLTASYDEETATLIAAGAGTRTTIETGLHVSGAAFDACAQSVVLVGSVPGGTTQRVVRVFFDGRPPSVLLETTGPGRELTRVEVDARGWVLIASDEPGVAAHVFVVSLDGSNLTEWTVPGRVFGASLGP